MARRRCRAAGPSCHRCVTARPSRRPSSHFRQSPSQRANQIFCNPPARARGPRWQPGKSASCERAFSFQDDEGSANFLLHEAPITAGCGIFGGRVGYLPQKNDRTRSPYGAGPKDAVHGGRSDWSFRRRLGSGNSLRLDGVVWTPAVGVGALEWHSDDPHDAGGLPRLPSIGGQQRTRRLLPLLQGSIPRATSVGCRFAQVLTMRSELFPSSSAGWPLLTVLHSLRHTNQRQRGQVQARRCLVNRLPRRLAVG